MIEKYVKLNFQKQNKKNKLVSARTWGIKESIGEG